MDTLSRQRPNTCCGATFLTVQGLRPNSTRSHRISKDSHAMPPTARMEMPCPEMAIFQFWSQFSSFRFYCSVSHFIYIKLWARLRRREETRRGHRPTRPTSTNRRCHPTTAPHLEIFATKQQFPDQLFSLQR